LKKITAISVFVSVAFLAMLTYPLVNIANTPRLFWGIPAMVFYIFALWIILVAVIVWLSKSENSEEQ